MTTKESQCDWTAWYDTMPGSSSTLHVTGKCTFPTEGYSVKLERVEVGIETPGVLQLRYSVEPPKGKVPQVVTVEEVRYSEDPNVVYKEVRILPDNIKIPVEQVSRTKPLKNGILVTFDVVGEQFKVWITNPDTIEQVKDLQTGESNAAIPNGRIHRGSGAGNHNAPYRWHLDPQEIAMAESTMEVCDARPSYVEAHVDEFVDTVMRFCPWDAKLVNVEDLRENLEGVAKS